MEDLTTREIFNEKFGFNKYLWVKEFVFSNLLEQYVALAGEYNEGEEENIVLVDVFGEQIVESV